jgi:crotonyl-CoA carboxylase/reductase
VSTFKLGTIPSSSSALPKKMMAVVVRPSREGPPRDAMQVEEIDLPPEPGPSEVLVLNIAAGVNYNGVWAARGKPASVFKMHSHPLHIPGSDSAGIVWRLGSQVQRWKVGDEVILHCNQSCGQCPECNGFDPMACAQQKIWGYETPWGSFAQFSLVQAQQLLAKPTHLSWVEAASYGLTYFTAYRMLLSQAGLTAGDNVLIWGGAGGLGIFAVQLCLLLGARPIPVVSSRDKGEQLKSDFGCHDYLVRTDYDLAFEPNEGAERKHARISEMKRFGAAIRAITGGADPDIVFEHVGQATFPTSVFVAKRFGKIVICGATTGFDLTYDVRHLWLRQKQIIGSHFCNGFQAERANRLVMDRQIRPVISKVFPLAMTGEAHAQMAANQHHGKMAIAIHCSPEFDTRR